MSACVPLVERGGGFRDFLFHKEDRLGMVVLFPLEVSPCSFGQSSLECAESSPVEGR